MKPIDWSRLSQRANADAELGLLARFWTADLRLDITDEKSRCLRFEDGELKSVSECAADAEADIFITATSEQWEHLMAPEPQPFYQDLFGASIFHGIALNEDLAEVGPYYPAIRRLIELMGETRA